MGREVDEATNKIVGKLLQDEEDEDVNANSETYKKLWAILGGPLPIVICAVYQQIQKYVDNYIERVNANYAIEAPEKQSQD